MYKQDVTHHCHLFVSVLHLYEGIRECLLLFEVEVLL